MFQKLLLALINGYLVNGTRQMMEEHFKKVFGDEGLRALNGGKYIGLAPLDGY